jgi:hypothetical protein
MRWPIGSCPGHSFRAVDSLTMTTFGDPSRSCAVNARPRRIGIESVLK